MDVIRTVDLTKSFGSLNAVNRITLSVAEGEIFGLVGPDGAGKTTTLRLLTSIMEPTSGKASIDGHDTVKEAETVKTKIGYMSQRFGLYSDLTVLENIHFYADLYGVPARERKGKIERLLSFRNLAPFQKRPAGNLSGGMKQKLGLACALIHTPKVLLLDEPTNGVDPISRRDFWRILYQLLREKVTIFVSTAYLDEAERCNRLALIHKGELLACGAPEEIKKLIPGTIIEVRSANPRRAATLLRRDLAADSVALFGNRLHILTQEPDKSVGRIQEILRGAGLIPESIRRIEPTLEDVFVSVLAQKNEAEESGAEPEGYEKG